MRDGGIEKGRRNEKRKGLARFGQRYLDCLFYFISFYFSLFGLFESERWGVEMRVGEVKKKKGLVPVGGMRRFSLMWLSGDATLKLVSKSEFLVEPDPSLIGAGVGYVPGVGSGLSSSALKGFLSVVEIYIESCKQSISFPVLYSSNIFSLGRRTIFGPRFVPNFGAI